MSDDSTDPTPATPPRPIPGPPNGHQTPDGPNGPPDGPFRPPNRPPNGPQRLVPGQQPGVLSPRPAGSATSCPWGRDELGYYIDPLKPGRRVCGARRRKTNDWCKGAPRSGSLRCRLHGGNTPRGMAAGGYKHGLYSAYLPAPIRTTFQAARSDPELLNLQDDVALYNARLTELFSRLGTGESGAAWADLLDLSGRLSGLSAELDAAIRSGDGARFTAAAQGIAEGIRALATMIDQARSREDLWAEIQDTQKGKVSVASAEWRRQVDLKTLIPADHAMSLVIAIMHSVKRNCQDVRAQEAIAHDIGSYLNDIRARTPRQGDAPPAGPADEDA